MSDVQVEKITPDMGVRVLISADHLLDDGVAAQCLAALNQYGVLVFPEINISDADQVEFSSRLGKTKSSKFVSDNNNEADKLGIYPVTLDPSKAKFLDYIHSNEHWHMDGTTYEVPPKATNLKCVVPPSSGGDTEFCNLYAAYDALPAEMKARLEGLRVVHSAAAANLRYFKNPTVIDLQRWLNDGPPTEQPLVWKQANGHTSLVIGSTADHIAGMDVEEGRALLAELLEWCTQPGFCYRHHWRKGDMVIFHNPGVLHRAHRYTVDSGRLMHRTTIMGSEAFA